MTLLFDKYHGCGNDFIIIDNTKGQVDQSQLTVDVIKGLCDRRYGIGADGLMIVLPSSKADFEMYYANADGRESSMCGNGGRCIVAFAAAKGIIQSHNCNFDAIDGLHSATIDESGDVSLGMSDVSQITVHGSDYVLDTGSPHYVTIVEDVEDFAVYTEGKSIRNSEPFATAGINVNFVEIKDGKYRIRTYERGVEAETEACGTGVTAAAIVLSEYYDAGLSIPLMTNGGLLTVKVSSVVDHTYTGLLLCGPATYVYSGAVEIGE